MSKGMLIYVPPATSTSARIFSNFSWERETPTTVAFSFASARAINTPIPPAAPVKTTVFPARFFMIS